MKQLKHFFYFFMVWSSVHAQVFTGKGFAPFEGNNELATVLATMDAISDAMLKRGGLIEGEHVMDKELLQSQKISFKSQNQEIKMLSRRCKVVKDTFECEVELKMSSGQMISRSNVKLPIPQKCQAKPGLQFCYEVQDIFQTKVQEFYHTRLVGELVLLWREESLSKRLVMKPFTLYGLGKTPESSRVSANQQLAIKSQKFEMPLRHYEKFRILKIKSSAMKEKTRLYLILLGGEVMCGQRSCFLMLPSLLFEAFF